MNVLLAAETRAKSVVIMNPAPVPLRRFTLAFVPVHDQVPKRPNIIGTVGALNALNGQDLAAARERLRQHPRFHPAIAGTPERPAISCLARSWNPSF